MSISLLLAVMIVVFLGALTRTTFGFGEAVITMPLLTLLPIHLYTVVSLMGFVGLTVSLVGVFTGWRNVNCFTLLPLALASLVGIPVGLLMVNLVPAAIITGLLGVLLITYGIYSIRQTSFALHTQSNKIHHSWGLFFGFLSGVLGSAYNFNGIPIAIYGSLRKWLPDEFRSNMQAYFLMSGILIVAGQGIGGLWNFDVFSLYCFSLPSIALAALLGTYLHKRIPTAKFQRYVFYLITLLGTVLLGKSIIHYMF